LGCYEERHRLTAHAVMGLAMGVVSVGLGAWWWPGLSAAGLVLAVPVVTSAAGVIFALPGVAAVACRMVAFRADCMGVTLGAVPDNLTFFGRRSVFVPWAEIEQIILYHANPRGRGERAPVRRISLRRQEGAVALAPAAASGTSRLIAGWRLDAERLGAIAAVVAPGVPVVGVLADGGGRDAGQRAAGRRQHGSTGPVRARSRRG
jgi:hypothetical protein